MKNSKKRKQTDYIVIHCADTYPGQRGSNGELINADEITKWHRARGFLTIGYHYIILEDGSLEYGREEDDYGAHVMGYNHLSLGICMVGGRKSRKDGKPFNTFNEAQFKTLANLIESRLKKYPDAEVVGHNELDSKKACPSFNIKKWMKEEYHDLIKN